MKLLLKEYKGNLLKMIFLSGILAALQVLPSYLLAYATNAIFQRDLTAFLMWDGIILFLWLIFVIFNYFMTIYQEKATQRISNSLRKKAADRIAQLAPAEFDEVTADGFISTLSNDILQIETQGMSSLYGIFANFWLIIFSTIALFLFNAWLVVIVLTMTLFILYIPHKFSDQLVAVGKQLSESNAQFVKSAANILKGYRVFHYSRNLQLVPQKIATYSENLAANKIAIAKTKSKITNLIGFSSLISQVLVDIFTGYLAIIGATTLGAISSSGSLAANIFNSVSLSGQLLIQLKSTEPIINNFLTVTETKLDKSRAPAKSFNQLEIKNLSFGYSRQQPLLTQIDLLIEKGGKYLLTGKSGGGKSTLLKIIAGELTNYQGTILLDGKDITKLDRTRLIQYIDQDSYLFNTSFKNNITLWGNYSQHEITQALNKASIDFITNLQEEVKNNGTNLSGGQKQRIALARAFIQNKSFILLDEGTSSLDKKNALLIENLLLDDPELTVIIVNHNPLPENCHKFAQIIDLDELEMAKLPLMTAT